MDTSNEAQNPTVDLPAFRKPYTAPELHTHGTLREMTQTDSVESSAIDQGTFPNVYAAS